MSDPDLSQRVDALTRSSRALEESISKENRLRAVRIAKAENAIRWSRRIAIGGCVVGLLGVFGAYLGNRALADSKASTTDARVASCKQYNAQQKQGVKSDEAEVRKFVSALAPNPSPELAARISDFLTSKDGYDATVANGHPLRNCTTEGIRKYLSTPTTKGP